MRATPSPFALAPDADGVAAALVRLEALTGAEWPAVRARFAEDLRAQGPALAAAVAGRGEPRAVAAAAHALAGLAGTLGAEALAAAARRLQQAAADGRPDPAEAAALLAGIAALAARLEGGDA